jgi:hypothetical protein
VKITAAGFTCEVTSDDPPDAVQTFEGDKETIESQFVEFAKHFKWISVLSVEGVE